MRVIPLQLTLKNFLSYREATLDFRGLHVACVCGANGSGKSSLLEAMTWVIWGQSRASTEDDVIHVGMMEASVDFLFQCHHHTYRIIRSRYRGQASTVEFQLQTTGGFRSLTEKGMRATQQLILNHIKLDYDTFINSAYLRQGRADEFMLKRPSDRKQILADLLKLDQYDQLAERAKEQSRELKAEITLLERHLESTTTQLQQEPSLIAEAKTLQATLQQTQHRQQQDQARLRQLQATEQQRQTWVQQLHLQQQQRSHLHQDCQRLWRELTDAQQQQQHLESMLQDAEMISSRYAHYQQLQADEEVQTAKFQAQQVVQAQRQQLQQQQTTQAQSLHDQIRQAQAQLSAVQQQQQENQQILAKTEEIEAALTHLHQARNRLSRFDQLQTKVAPLIQRQQQIHTQLDREQTKLMARREELKSLCQQFTLQLQRQPQLQRAIQEVTTRIEYFEQQRLYQQQVREKGMERRTFLERLQERQRDYEQELSELDHKILMLNKDSGNSLPSHPASAIEFTSAKLEQRTLEDDGHTAMITRSTPLRSSVLSTSFPPCPLCDRPLDEHHWQVVLERHRVEQQEIHNQLWVIREQLTTSDREIRLLRQEYRDVEKELTQYGTVLERRGQLQQQLQTLVDGQAQLQRISAEIAQLEQILQQKTYATDLQDELRLLNQSLTELDYDEQDHALARGEVDRWRWAEIKHAEIRQAQRRQAHLAGQQPILEATITKLQQEQEALAVSPLQQQIDECDHHLATIDYQLEYHSALKQRLRDAQTWQLRYQELLQAQQTYPSVQRRIQELRDLWTQRSQAFQAATTQVEALSDHLDSTPDASEAIQTLEQQMQQRRQELDAQLSRLGRLQQQLQQLQELRGQLETRTVQVQAARRQYRVYQELAQAFGKNGIQALMIENVLPQLEAETNQILGRLSANQLHVQFITQRASRKSKSTATKYIDTLDILIGDVNGTRPYETYSGGEAFRVNFAIRLALARLLAQRSGMALQLLVVDEGFGTQDQAGCDRLVGAINAISADFACILAVTHIPHLKEAFQTRIEISKSETGSYLQLLG